MNASIKLTATKLPKMLSDLTHSNQFLKVFSISVLGVLAIALVLIVILVSKAPLVLALTPTAGKMQVVELPKADEEVKAAINEYLEKRYKWEPQNVMQKLAEAEAFVLPGSKRAFQGAVANVTKFYIEKLVSQKVYPEKIEVNLEKKVALITGDRVTAIQGLKAAGNLKLELSFESGPRTRENPWGIYIIKEKEEM